MGVTLLHNALPRNIVGCALSAPDGSSPRGYSQKRLFRVIGSKYSVVHHTSPRDTLISSCYRIRVHHPNKELLLISLTIVAPKAIIENPSHIILSINFVLVRAILLLSYTIFFMTSMNTSLCMSANRFMGSTVIFVIFDR
jgi:hypothetical protein